MTPQEKAKLLLDCFMNLSEEQEYDTPRYMSKEMAIQCALIAANEVLNETSNKHFIIGRNGSSGVEYWEKVKQELENL